MATIAAPSILPPIVIPVPAPMQPANPPPTDLTTQVATVCKELLTLLKESIINASKAASPHDVHSSVTQLLSTSRKIETYIQLTPADLKSVPLKSEMIRIISLWNASMEDIATQLYILQASPPGEAREALVFIESVQRELLQHVRSLVSCAQKVVFQENPTNLVVDEENCRTLLTTTLKHYTTMISTRDPGWEEATTHLIFAVNASLPFFGEDQKLRVQIQHSILRFVETCQKIMKQSNPELTNSHLEREFYLIFDQICETAPQMSIPNSDDLAFSMLSPRDSGSMELANSSAEGTQSQGPSPRKRISKTHRIKSKGRRLSGMGNESEDSSEVSRATIDDHLGQIMELVEQFFPEAWENLPTVEKRKFKKSVERVVDSIPKSPPALKPMIPISEASVESSFTDGSRSESALIRDSGSGSRQRGSAEYEKTALSVLSSALSGSDEKGGSVNRIKSRMGFSSNRTRNKNLLLQKKRPQSITLNLGETPRTEIAALISTRVVSFLGKVQNYVCQNNSKLLVQLLQKKRKEKIRN